MTLAAMEVVRTLLKVPSNPGLTHRPVAPDATYVSFAIDNPELLHITPWAGTRAGPEAMLDIHNQLDRSWRSEAFEARDKVSGGQVTSVQVMDEAFGTASTFRSGGAATYHSDPDGSEGAP